MEDWHFPRAYHLDAQAVDHMPRHPFDRTRSQIMNACREQAEARLRSYGAGDLLAAEPEIIPLTEEDDSPLGVPNFAFAWRDGAGGILVMPQRFSWELADIERRQRRNGSTRQGLIDAARPV